MFESTITMKMITFHNYENDVKVTYKHVKLVFINDTFF